jgi:hypothetical protein
MENHEIKLPKGVDIRPSTFDEGGGMLNYEVPEGADLVILMGNRGGGYVPFRCLLPHQVYLKDIRKAFEDERFEVIYLVGVSAKAPLPIAFNGDYGRERWENK